MTPLSTGRLLLLTCLLFILPACQKSHPVKAGNNEYDLPIIGWLHGNCLAVKNSTIIPGTKVWIINPDASDQYSQARIVAKTNEPEQCYALLDDRVKINSSENRHFYQVSHSPAIELAFGVILPESRDNTKPVYFDLNSDQHKDTFSYCNTSEGIIFSIWAGAPDNSTQIWSDYYYLGYDMEANCP